ncbi:MAG TPA: HEAT repeat domain-containing protein [Oligoflexus sp.]|uniref:HEAT repeat domain-containing protein n=1 Tax=Oligoflexus sp. TaxID=1971216 RepID=UPI002D33BB74|nr:HEAT repeat domain-containing protein [Oligoflexus sp.]HYX33194.1 HEAT repeat domain-containing protein [Oligoflexus sp.]
MKALLKSRLWIPGSLILLAAVGIYLFIFNKTADLTGWLPKSGPKIYKIDYVSKGQSESLTQGVSGSEMSIELTAYLELRLQCNQQRLICEVSGRVWPEALKSSHEAFLKEELSQAIFTFDLHSQGLIKNIRMDRQSIGHPSVLVIDILRNLNLNLPNSVVNIGELWPAMVDIPPYPIESRLSVTSSDRKMATLVQTFQTGKYESVSGNGKFQLDHREKDIAAIHIERSLYFQNDFGMKISNQLTFSALRVLSVPPHLSLVAAAGQPHPEQMIKETFTHDALVAMAKQEKEKEILGQSTKKELYDRLSKAGSDRKKNMPLYRQIKALFNLQPESVKDFKSFLADHDIGSEQFKIIATALTAVGNDPCQKLIRETIESLSDGKRRRRLIPNLAFLDHPSEQSEELLWQLPNISADQELISLGERSLGTMAHNLRLSEPDRARKIYERFSSQLAAAETVEQRVHNLAVIGNIGLSQNLATANQYISAQNDLVRAKAYDSLRHVNEATAKDILLDGLVKEVKPLVKETIAEALVYGELGPDHVLKIQEQLRTEKNIKAIKSLLRSLANQKSANAEAIILQFQKRCAHPDLCGFVDSLVSGLKS